MNDFLKQRAEKDLAELKKLIENHFAQVKNHTKPANFILFKRKQDEEVLNELVQKMESRKELRQQQIEDRNQREKERGQRERDERNK
jgi:alpha-acetolactate decarboxylase